MRSPMTPLAESEVLVIAALEQELQGLFEKEGVEVHYTGLGKINATYFLTKALSLRASRGQKTKLVLNFGTAGSGKFKTQSLIECVSFVQRDMDVSALGFKRGETPFDVLPIRLEFPPLGTGLEVGCCGSGDNFETAVSARLLEPAAAFDVVDMEAYALGKVCALEGLHFAAIKFITDGADDQAHLDWVSHLPLAAESFFNVYRNRLPNVKKV